MMVFVVLVMELTVQDMTSPVVSLSFFDSSDVVDSVDLGNLGVELLSQYVSGSSQSLDLFLDLRSLLLKVSPSPVESSDSSDEFPSSVKDDLVGVGFASP